MESQPLHYVLIQPRVLCAVSQTCLFFPQDKLLYLHFLKYVEIAVVYSDSCFHVAVRAFDRLPHIPQEQGLSRVPHQECQPA